MKIRCVKMGINGEGIGYVNRIPVFCEGVLPEETAEVEITDRKPSYMKAKALRIIEKSQQRVKPACRYQKNCGGCPLMIVHKKEQSAYKKQLLEEALYKYAGVKRHFVREVHESPLFLGSRNQFRLPVAMKDGKLITGMYQTGTNHFVEIDSCLTHDPALESARVAVLEVLNRHHVSAYDKKTKKGLRYLVIRTLDGKTQCTLISGNMSFSKPCIDDLLQIEGMLSVFQSVNNDLKGAGFFGHETKLLAGEAALPVTIGSVNLQLSPESFFQLNLLQAEKMYEMAVSKVDRCSLLVEAYCGIGTMSLMAADRAKKVIGIETVESAVINAAANAKINHIKNAEFLCMDAAEGLYRAARRQPVDILLADPPRSGMDDNMIQAILHTRPEKIIYISCNPATLAKNINSLKHDYHVVTVIPYDMFPSTAHVESITVLQADHPAKQAG